MDLGACNQCIEKELAALRDEVARLKGDLERERLHPALDRCGVCGKAIPQDHARCMVGCCMTCEDAKNTLTKEVERLKGKVKRKDKCLCNAMAIVKQAQACMTHNTYPACHCWPCQVERALLPALAPAPKVCKHEWTQAANVGQPFCTRCGILQEQAVLAPAPEKEAKP